jgi:hypothetical protein
VKPSPRILLLVAAFLAGGVGVWALSADDAGPPADAPPTAAEPSDAVIPPPSPPSGDELPAEEKETVAEERAAEVERVVRDYVVAISDHDGAVLCGLVDGIADLDLPVRRGSCAESVSESIGYRDPRGVPVFEKAVVTGAPQIEIERRDARATATIVSEFADREEASVEDDVIYLMRRGREWVIAKPSSTLYRAIGTPDVPPEVLEPPEQANDPA